MANVYNIEFNDTNENMIRKLNHNFKAIANNQSARTDKRIRLTTDSLVEDINEAFDEVEDEIQAVDDKFANYTMTTDLAAVALSNDYADLDNKPTIPEPSAPDPVGCAYLTFGSENPATVKDGTWSQVGTITVGSRTLKVWEKTAS